jgi:glutamyl-tRNA reductase
VSVVVIGLNHRTAPLDLLERMSVGDGQITKALHDLTTREHISEALVLSTCNRTEVYAVAERFHGAYSDIRGFLADFSYLPPDEFADHLYVHYDTAAVSHYIQTAGSTPRCWARARSRARSAGLGAGAAEGTTGRALNLLLRHALEAGKRAHSSKHRPPHRVGVAGAVSWPASGWAASRPTVLGARAGEMGEGMAVALAGAGAGRACWWQPQPRPGQGAGGGWVASRCRWPRWPTGWATLTCCSRPRGPECRCWSRPTWSRSATRPDRPLLIVDTMPRDVDPGVGEVPGVTLLDMDDLRRRAGRGRAPP